MDENTKKLATELRDELDAALEVFRLHQDKDRPDRDMVKIRAKVAGVVEAVLNA